GKFKGQGHRDDQRGEKDGGVEYRNDSQGYRFQSTSVSTVQFTQLGTNPLTGNPIWKLHMTGTGINWGQTVTYTVDMVDNGANGLGDTFLLTTSDGRVGGGQLIDGNNTYNHYAD